MARRNRAETQERNRARVLAAAREEFTERGYRDAKIDAIADRADLTRGAVYSNFPGKRALYFAVLAEDAERASPPSHNQFGRTGKEALGAFARAWVARLASPGHGGARLGVDLIPEILADERTRRPFTQLMKLDALLLGLAIEHFRPAIRLPKATPRREVRMAETVLTMLHGASQLAAAAPGFGEPFDVVTACECLERLSLNDYWAPPDIVAPVRSVDEPWSPPEAVDLVRGEPAPLTEDGVVTVLGLHRLAAAEEALRVMPRDARVTAVLVTGDPGELAALARLTVVDLGVCLRQAYPRPAWPRLRVVCDESAAIATAAGVSAVSDATETAIRIEGGRIVARAEGSGAGHAVASAGVVKAPRVSR